MNIFVREDFRRDGLCMNFLFGADEMRWLARSFPQSIINIGYPAICLEEKRKCLEIVAALQNEPVELAVVGHALPHHLEDMASVINGYANTSANFWIPLSDYFIDQTMRKSPDELLKYAKQMINYWHTLSKRPVDIALADATAKESNLRNRLRKFYDELKQNGARNIIICDTRGIADTKRITDLLVSFRYEKELSLEYHPHNDNGNALGNIETAVLLGTRGIGTGVFGAGERNSMVDPRLLVAKYQLPYNPDAFNQFNIVYNQLIQSLDEPGKLFRDGVVVTGAQYRLRKRSPELITLCGVTSDKHILAKILNMPQEEISDAFLECIKNNMYTERKRIYSKDELLIKKEDFENGRR